MAAHLLIHRWWIAAGFRGKDRTASRAQAAIRICAVHSLLAVAMAIILGLLEMAAALVVGTKQLTPRRELAQPSPSPAHLEPAPTKFWRTYVRI